MGKQMLADMIKHLTLTHRNDNLICTQCSPTPPAICRNQRSRLLLHSCVSSRKRRRIKNANTQNSCW